MKHKYFLITCLLFLIPPSLIAQATAPAAAYKAVSVINNTALKKVNIQFESEKEIENLLVIVFDRRGETIFLDNQYRFKGKYDQSIDLKEYGKGEFSLKVVRDENMFQQKIIIP